MDNKGDRTDQASTSAQGLNQLYPAHGMLFPASNENEIGTPDGNIATTTVAHASATIQHNPSTPSRPLNQNIGLGTDAKASSAGYANSRLPPLNINQDQALPALNGSQLTPRTSYAQSGFIEHDGYIADLTSPARHSITEGRSHRRDSYVPIPPTRRPYNIKDRYTPSNPFNQSRMVSGTHQVLNSALPPSGTQSPGSRPGPETPQKNEVGFWTKVVGVPWHGYLVQAFNCALLFLPALYCSRVAKIYTRIQYSGGTLRSAIRANREKQLELELGEDANALGSSTVYWDISGCPPEVEQLRKVWDNFINAVTKEWETMNLVAILLVGAIVASIQIGPVFADEIIRYIAFAALVCSSMSLIFSCTHIICFPVVRPVHRAVEWAKEGAAANTRPFWNVWILLSLPAIWLSWALILFVAEIIAFMWLCDNPNSATTFSPRLRLAAKVVISVILASGIVDLGLIFGTLRRYGEQMDLAWKQSIDEELLREHPLSPRPLSSVSHSTYRTTRYFDLPLTHTPVNEALRQSPELISKPVHGEENATEFYRPVTAVKFSFYGGRDEQLAEPPRVVYRRLGDRRIWNDFVQETIQIWKSAPMNLAWGAVLGVIRRWNQEQLRPRHMEAFLAYETGPPPSQIQHYLVYVTDQSFATSLSRHFPNVPDGVEHSQIFDDTGALKLTLAPPGKAEPSDKTQRSRPDTERKRSKTSSDGGTLDIAIYPPSTPGSRASTVDSDYRSAAEASDAVSNTPTEVEVEPSPVPEVPKEVEEPPTPVARPEILRRPRSAMRTPSSRSLESKRVRHADEIPAIPSSPPVMTQIPEASRTTEELATQPPAQAGPGVSPLLRRHLSHRFLYDHSAEIQETYSTDELSALATLIPTPTLVIWHKQIPYTLYVKKDTLITINDLLDELGKQLHKPVPKNYLRGSEPDVVSRLRTAAGQRARAGGKRGGQDPPPAADVICTADWIWSKKIRIAGFVEHPNGTWELETQEN